MELIKRVGTETVHLILSDIPYGIGAEEWDVLHENRNSAYLGSSPAQRVAGQIFKKRGKPINGWSEADRDIPRSYQDWCSKWAPDWLRVLKPGGNVFVFAGRRLAHRCTCAMEEAGFSLKDTLAWIRSQAPHRAQRLSAVFERRGDQRAATEWKGWRLGNLRPTYEPILWFVKPYRLGKTIADNALTHGVGAYNESAYTRYVGKPDNVVRLEGTRERSHHPTQKPVELMQVLIELTTKTDHVVLDPFAGSGSTLVAAKNLRRRFIGFESIQEYVDACKYRLSSDLFA